MLKNDLKKELLLHFLEDRAVESMSKSSSNNISGKYQIIEDGIVNLGQSSRSGSGLRLVGLKPFRLDSSLGNKQDWVLKLLFKLGNKLGMNFLNKLKAGNWNEDKNDILSLLALNNGLDFFGTGDEDVLNLNLELGGISFELMKSLSNAVLQGSSLLLKMVKESFLTGLLIRICRT
jgi:hypothetical protein